MAHPFNQFTFNLKIEFLLAYVPCHEQTPYPDEHRTFRFPHPAVLATSSSSSDALRECICTQSSHLTPNQHSLHHREAAIKHIARTLQTATILTGKSHNHWSSIRTDTLADMNLWTISSNDTVHMHPPPNSSTRKYTFLPLSISSPAYYYTDEALSHIKRFCNVMTSTYLIHVNPTCGMHISIGYGVNGFSFQDVKFMALFFWAFEPQFASLNSRAGRRRVGKGWRRSMRDNCNFQAEYQLGFEGERLSAQSGLQRIIGTKDVFELLEGVGQGDGGKEVGGYGDVNFEHIYRAYQARERGEEGGENKWRERIEFRGQVATFEEDEVVNCIELWIGIVRFLKFIWPDQIGRIMEIAKLESWEKVGDRLDDQRQEVFGPILAEGEFPITTLLRCFPCGLEKQAEFYEDKWERNLVLSRRRRGFENRRTRRIVWEFEQDGFEGNREFEAVMRERGEESRMYAFWYGGEFDPDEWVWPRHWYEDLEPTETSLRSPVRGGCEGAFRDGGCGDESEGESDSGSDGEDFVRKKSPCGRESTDCHSRDGVNSYDHNQNRGHKSTTQFQSQSSLKAIGQIPFSPTTTISKLDAEEARLDRDIAIEEEKVERKKKMDVMWERAYHQEVELELELELGVMSEGEMEKMEDTFWRERVGIMDGIEVGDIMGVRDPFRLERDGVSHSDDVGGIDRDEEVSPKRLL